MDAESQDASHESLDSADHVQVNSSPYRHSNQLESQCIVCRRVFSLETEAGDDSETISICRECNIMALEDNEAGMTARDIRHRRRQRARARFGSSESTEDSFSQRFSHLIYMANQNHDPQFESESPVTVWHRSNFSASRSRSRRRWRVLSDNESDSLDHVDSVFGESDSNFSFGAYGGDSDASMDRHSLVDREMFVQLDSESFIHSDTDIDPMHAGLDRWDSDDQDEDGEWEEADFDETIGFAEPPQQFQDANISPAGTTGREAQDGAWVHWRGENLHVHYADIFEEFEVRPPYVGNPGDYLDARGFEELLEQLAETDGSRRGAPPASASFVVSLPCVVISKDHEKHGSLVCAVCKDPLLINMEAKQLPCKHLYHPDCILPWLHVRCSCPICRYELPTDDPEYEEGKRNTSRTEMHVTQQDPAEESSYDIPSDLDADEAHDFGHHGREEHGGVENVEQVRDNSSRGGRGALGFLFAAAPIASILGFVLVLWFQSPMGNRRIHCNTSEQDPQQLHRSQSAMASTGRNRRWWSIF